MRDPERIERILRMLESLWKKYPDQRLGQLLGNWVFINLWNQEDDITEERLEFRMMGTKK